MKTKILTTGVLVAAILLLVFERQRIRRDTAPLHALSDTLDRQASALLTAPTSPAAAKPPIAPSTSPTTTAAPTLQAKKKPLPPGVFAAH